MVLHTNEARIQFAKALYFVRNTGKPARMPHVRALPPAFKFRTFSPRHGPSGLKAQRLNAKLI